MDKLKYIKLENEDGTYSSSIPLAVDSDYVDINGETLTSVIAEKASQASVNLLQSEINGLTSGAPKGSYETVAALVSANPNTGVYIVQADGHSYSWTKDGSSAVDLGVYQANGLSADDNLRINKTTAECININVQPTIHGYVKYTDGTFNTVDSEGTRTDYILISEYTNIEYRTNISSTGCNLAFYDSAKNYLKDISIPGDGNHSLIRQITVPVGAYYVILSTWGSRYLSEAYLKAWKENSIVQKINDINNDIDTLENKIEENEDKIKDDINKIEKIGWNIYTPDIIGYIRMDNGNVHVDENAKHTDYINLSNIDIIYYNTHIAYTGAAVAFYDENKTYLPNLSIPGVDVHRIAEGTIQKPSGAKYAILSFWGIGESYPTGEILKTLYTQENLLYTTSFLYDKNILIFGDSITECTNIVTNENVETTSYSWSTREVLQWPRIIKKNYDMREIRCYAKSGGHYRYYEESASTLLRNMCYQVDLALNDKDNPNNVFSQDSFTPDIVIFAAGTNDGASPNDDYATAMGKTVYEEDGKTINVNATLNNLDKTKFCQAVRYCLLKIKQQWPMAQIYMMLPMQRCARENAFTTTNEVLTKLGIRYGAVIVDQIANGITNEGNVLNGSGTTLSDGLHPNAAGINLIARQIIKSMESNYLDLSNMNPIS